MRYFIGFVVLCITIGANMYTHDMASTNEVAKQAMIDREITSLFIIGPAIAMMIPSKKIAAIVAIFSTGFTYVILSQLGYL